jgi:hypothetical protein
MNDDDLEALLRRYRPLGPPDALRRQITAAARPSRMRPRDWLPVAAAVILVVAFSWLAGIERQRLSANVTPVPPIDQQSPLDTDQPLR